MTTNFVTMMLLNKHILDDCSCNGCRERTHEVVFSVSKTLNDMFKSKIVLASLTLDEMLDALDSQL